MSTLRERQLSAYSFFIVLAVNAYTVIDNLIVLNFPDALKQMLNLNQPLTKSVACEPTWKVLIYDRVGQDVISPLISIKELRELGVTLHV